ncbi:hypothetical protein CBS101457_001153 [Exobasidium rhododendri]|nr:hypothetical protein CBS101457_001153 [Exobasidium rhododendri]
MGVQSRSKKGDAVAVRSRPSKSGGEGKKKKIFSETLGKDHMIELSNSIADSYTSKLQERVDKAKGKAKWEKEKRVEKMKSKAGVKDSGNDVVTAPKKDEMKGKKQPLSKSSIRASLLAKQREKAKQRKDARKAALKVKLQASTTTAKGESEVEAKPRRKQVSFI